MNTVDATSPFVLDTRPLRRRAGAMTAVLRTAPAPPGWEVSTCMVEPGSDVEIALRLEGVVEGVLVSGDARVVILAECSRCLDPLRQTRTVRLQQLFEYDDIETPAELSDDPLPKLRGEQLDLEATLRDAVVLDLPMVPVCEPGCPGLCTVCGARLADDPLHRHDSPDERWAALRGWTEQFDPGPTTHPDGKDA